MTNPLERAAAAAKQFLHNVADGVSHGLAGPPSEDAPGIPSTMYPLAANMSGNSPGNGPALAPGTVKNLGPIAGTGAQPGISSIGAADLGEIVTLPNGRLVSVFGDSFKGNRVGGPDSDHYRSVAVPIAGWENDGRAIYGTPFNGTGGPGSPNILFPPPNNALMLDPNTNTLPAGSILVGDTTYMMVAGTAALHVTAGSWLVQVTDDPADGWHSTLGSWRAGDAPNTPSQISGYLAADGMVYIVGDAFNRSQGVTLYRVDPATVTDRNSWQPWTGTSWGAPGNVPQVVSGQQTFGELSMRQVGSSTVLSGFNSTTHVWQVEVRVAADPTQLFAAGTPVVVAAQQHTPTDPNFVFQPYGGYIVPGSTLTNMNLLVSQWNTGNDANGVPLGAPYDTQQMVLNVASSN
ncbi:DUF4185 domain-containing protein [Mycobacterium sp. OTB74]|uniref:DUF4185 domain-containing protein n=1 Tax=Mycobacterium sp. OTB74 TaxID=1853452 RepID=UPI002472F220|nr:DUF4185 domain-containing protein [Mycobacterium sp. OTB74]MDH6246357.1 hypothetical protein [Mycobacterium sp. OTB74]